MNRELHPVEHTLARRFRALRQARELTLREVQVLTGVSINTSSRLERGKGISIRSAACLAEGFGYPLHEFLAGDRILTEIRELAAARLAALEAQAATPASEQDSEVTSHA